MTNYNAESEEKDEPEMSFLKKKENIVILIGIIVVAIAIATPFLILFSLGWKFENLGVIGDFFGGTTVGLFTLASIIFVIAAIMMQKRDLELQKKDLALTRKEFKTGNATAKVQQVDNAFYNMLSLHHQIVNNIKITNSKQTYTGREAIFLVKHIFEKTLALKILSRKFPDNPQYRIREMGIADDLRNSIFDEQDTIDQELLNEAYKDIQDEFGNDIGHYMRNNYRIVKFIVNNVANNEVEQEKIKLVTGREPIIGDTRYYFGMLRAQWSIAEFELLFINSLYPENIKFKNLILEYDVFDIEDRTEKKTSPQNFKLKISMNRFKLYKQLIESNN